MSELGSLSQSARKSSLKGARGILIFLGIINLLANLGMAIFAENFVDWQIEQEARNLPPGMVLDPEKVAEIRPGIVQSVRVASIGFSFIGVAFLIGAVKIYDYPVPVTIISLVLYLGAIAITAVLDPTTLAQGLIFKIIFIVALAKAVGTAMAYERERGAVDEDVAADEEPLADAYSV